MPLAKPSTRKAADSASRPGKSERPAKDQHEKLQIYPWKKTQSKYLNTEIVFKKEYIFLAFLKLPFLSSFTDNVAGSDILNKLSQIRSTKHI